MRLCVACAALLVHLFVSALIPTTWSGEPATKLLLAHGAINSNVTPLWIAKDQGLFRKHGLDVDLVFIIAGRAAQAMLAGQVTVALVGATHVTNAVTAGGDLTMILGLQNRLDYLFISRPTIRGGEELKGKKVAIGTPSGSASLATLDFSLTMNAATTPIGSGWWRGCSFSRLPSPNWDADSRTRGAARS